MRTALAAAVICILLANACCGPSADTPAAAMPDGFAVRRPDVPIENFACVADGVYRGAQPDEAGFRALRDMGVRTVITFRQQHSDRAMAEAVGIKVVEMPLHAFIDSDPPTEDEVKAFLDCVRDAERRPVYFHCAYGKDRTGTMCAVYRMEVDGWTPERALEEMRAFGFHEKYRDLSEYVLAYKPRAQTQK